MYLQCLVFARGFIVHELGALERAQFVMISMKNEEWPFDFCEPVLYLVHNIEHADRPPERSHISMPFVLNL